MNCVCLPTGRSSNRASENTSSTSLPQAQAPPCYRQDMPSKPSFPSQGTIGWAKSVTVWETSSSPLERVVFAVGPHETAELDH